jgi:hypothetical protein
MRFTLPPHRSPHGRSQNILPAIPGKRAISPVLMTAMNFESHRQFTCVRLSHSHLTHSLAPFPHRSLPEILAPAAYGSLDSHSDLPTRWTYHHLWYSTSPPQVRTPRVTRPLSPSAALDRHGECQGISCRQRRCGATGEDDPSAT